MKRIIDGKIYDTTTATFVCELPCSDGPGDFRFHDTSVYLSPGGTFFLSGHGGPASMWARECGGGAWCDGSGIRLITEAEARGHAENAEIAMALYEEVFGTPVAG